MLRKLAKSGKATGTVEFALVGLLLFTLMFGIFEGGQVFNSWLVITNEAREGARWGAVRVGDPAYSDLNLLAADTRSQVLSRIIVLDPAFLTVTASATDASVTVQITYIAQIRTPLIAAFWPSFPLAAESTMRSE